MTDRAVCKPMPRVAIIGAGISGLICARTLQQQGLSVQVFEKSRGLGGRMATRRVESPTGDHDELFFDHGAQYFTARNERFCEFVDSWLSEGLVQIWSGKIAVLQSGIVKEIKGDDIARYVATPRMNSVTKYLGRNLDVQFQTRVTSLTRCNSVWQLRSEDTVLGNFDVVVVTAPAPQTAELLIDSPHLKAKANSVKTAGCWAAMLAFNHSLDNNFDAAFVHDSPISWLSKNSSKPAREQTPETWVVHASPQWSDSHMEDDAADVLDSLKAEFFRVLSVSPSSTIYQAAHRWRFAIPEPLTAPCLYDDQLQIGACGDWCAGPRVEGAFLSGLAIADRILGTLTKQPSNA